MLPYTTTPPRHPWPFSVHVLTYGPPPLRRPLALQCLCHQLMTPPPLPTPPSDPWLFSVHVSVDDPTTPPRQDAS